MVNVFNVERGGSDLDQTEADAIKLAIYGNWVSELAPLISNTVTLDRVTITDLNAVNNPQFIYGTTDTGALSDNPIPNQAAGVITWRTVIRGRSFRGRSYIGGFTEAHSAGSAPDAAVITALDSFATSVIADTGTAGHPLVVVSRYHQVVPGTPPTVPRTTNISTLVIAHNTDQAWKTQRSRAL